MTWSPLACGIISGKYDSGVPSHSRASLKVFLAMGYNLSAVLSVCPDCCWWWSSLVTVCLNVKTLLEFLFVSITLWDCEVFQFICHTCMYNRWMYKHFCVVLFSLLWYVLPFISLHIAIECFWFPKKIVICFFTVHCIVWIKIPTDMSRP